MYLRCLIVKSHKLVIFFTAKDNLKYYVHVTIILLFITIEMNSMLLSIRICLSSLNRQIRMFHYKLSEKNLLQWESTHANLE